jgi:Tfp pilus assembly protein PilF
LSSENKTCEAIAILQAINNTQPSYLSALLLAENYQNINELKNAEINYEKAIKYLPNRILPRYHLFMNYLLMKNYSKADLVKKEALLLSYKGDTLFINQIKESLCKYNINEKKTDFNQ